MKMSRKPVEIHQTDLEWKFIKGGGPGGQAINKTSNCVQLTHTPTGIQIKCQKSRDLETNKNYAIKALKEKLDEQINGTNSLANIKAQKLQKQKQRRQRRSNEKYGHNKLQEDVKQEIQNEITQELLRKRAEHNEMMLTNLEEISIHQEEIVKIENLDVYCRHLKILLLQNNIIEKMENLHKLRELEYLNLALNNIKLIEGIENCESLMKLDLTVNFVDLQNLEKSVQCLQKCRLKELYLTGNPCTDWQGCRDYVIGQVDSLHSLDGKEITHTERIKAKQILPQLQKELIYAIEEEKIKEEQRIHEEKIRKEMNPNSEDKVAYTPETRKEMYLRQAKEKEEKERQRNPEKFIVKQETPLYMNDGRIRQCDEGGYKPIVNNWEDPENVTFKMIIPKYLDTSLIQVNVNPTYVSVRVKGKLTQIRLDEEVFAEKSKIQRSEITGELVITMPKVNPNEILKQIAERKKKEEQQKQQEQMKQQEMKQKQEKQNLDLLIQKAQAKLTQQIDDDIPDLE